jgi:hypothetical protein
MQNCRPMDMRYALFHRNDHLQGSIIRRNYGAGAIENADERLKEDLAAGRIGRGQIRVQNAAVTPLSRAQDGLEQNDKAITRARLRREALEKEVKEARLDEKRQAAFVRKWEGKGAKPQGVVKTKPATPTKVKDGRLTKALVR